MAFTPSKDNCKVQIRVDHEMEKAYAVSSGSNGKGGRSAREYYQFVAKSICYIEDGKVFAPSWATRGIPFSEIIKGEGENQNGKKK